MSSHSRGISEICTFVSLTREIKSAGLARSSQQNSTKLRLTQDFLSLVSVHSIRIFATTETIYFTFQFPKLLPVLISDTFSDAGHNSLHTKWYQFLAAWGICLHSALIAHFRHSCLNRASEVHCIRNLSVIKLFCSHASTLSPHFKSRFRHILFRQYNAIQLQPLHPLAPLSL